MERTLCIIKPDSVRAKKQGAILQQILDAGFDVLALRQVHMSRAEAEGFYAVHKERPFFGDLVKFMTSGPAIVVALEADNAVERYRALVGATNPAEAAPGTLRQQYGTSIDNNSVHGSDSVENGMHETAYFFTGIELS